MTIAAGDKILKGLYADEQFKILPVLMEVKCSDVNREYKLVFRQLFGVQLIQISDNL